MKNNMTKSRVFTSTEWNRMQWRDHRVINVIMSPKFGTKFYKFDSSARVFWAIYPSIGIQKSQYAIQDLQGVLTSVSGESFLEILSSCCPEDYEFFLWHPEARKGEWENDS